MKVIKTYEQIAESTPCWSGYKQIGTKKKAGKIVPNCVPVVEEDANADVSPMGFVISFTIGSRELAMSYTLAGIYDTFYDFASEVNSDLGFEEDEEEPREFKDVEDLMDHIFEVMEIREGDYQFWHGFKIRSGASGYHSESNLNCYTVVDMLDKLFVNPKEIIMGKDVNNSFNLSYLARSIENSPEKLLMYEDDKEMYDKIVRLLNWDKKKLDAILKVNRIKNQF
jgi:hypothetical protein